MTCIDDVPLKRLTITGLLDVHNVQDMLDTRITGDRFARTVLLMGPTGAGKSSFVEAFSASNSSVKHISSGQLEGYTQEVTAYELKGIEHETARILLIDTPGFADENISALEIVDKVRAWLDTNQFQYIFRVLYFTPITSTRLPGTQKAVLKTFKALTGTDAAGGITIVTTMWDSVWGEQAQKRAERNLEQLRSEVWEDFVRKKSNITQFHNTRESALQILDLAMERNRYQYFHMESAFKDATKSSKTIFAANLHSDLVSRIYSLRMKRDVILSDLADSDTPDTGELKGVLESELSQVNHTLAKFEQQLADFGPPPITSPPVDQPNPSESGSHSPPQPPRSLPKNIVPAREPQPEPHPEGQISRIWGSTKHMIKKATKHKTLSH